MNIIQDANGSKPNTSKQIADLIRARILLEQLILKRNPTDYQAYVETFRQSLIDANPHQVEAVVFALEKLEDGGCILADEVGLGKTIEAGLIISQYRAQRRFNVLIIVPTALAGQWNNELSKLFQIPSQIITSANRKKLAKNEKPEAMFKEAGVFIIGREYASRLEKDSVLSQKHWDLIVVDEAHEFFANIHRRFSAKTGEYNPKSKDSTTAGYLYHLFKRTPLLLLTATPIQNNIMELWGLSSYILPERNKSHLGKFNHFKELFIEKGQVPPSKIPDLKERVSNFLIRNLRTDAQLYMNYRFTDRNCETLNFNMSEEEKSLYHDIEQYFDRDDIYAYSVQGGIDLKDEKFAGIRTLLKISYGKALGSSFAALKSSLEGILYRLENLKQGKVASLEALVCTDDPQNDEEDRMAVGLSTDSDFTDTDKADPIDIKKIEYEIEEIQSYIQRANAIETTNKDKQLLSTLHKMFQETDRFAEKAVIFTTYIKSQEHLKHVLEKNGFEGEVILFSGTPTKSGDEKALIQEAVSVWEEEVGNAMSPDEKPTGTILDRTALVYLFKTRKKIFISTEAGAKGLNLQFCNILINYDLPWNPQRIEQRIGRCHRYGQERDVLVINCINADNDTENRIYELLQNKFDLFKDVLKAGDDILGTLSKAVNFEVRINDILTRFKTKEERAVQLQRFEDEIDEATRQLRDKKMVQTRKLIDELDPIVKERLNAIKEELPRSFSQYDEDMLAFMRNYALAHEIPFEELEKHEEQLFFSLDNQPHYIGKRDDERIRGYQHISLKHESLQHIIKQVESSTDTLNGFITFDYSHSDNKSELIRPFLQGEGVWQFYKVLFTGLEEEERIYHIMGIQQEEGIQYVSAEEAQALLQLPFQIHTLASEFEKPNAEEFGLESCLNIRVERDMLRIQNSQQPRIDRKLTNLKTELKDMEEYLHKHEEYLVQEMESLNQSIKQATKREEGEKLLKKRASIQTELSNTRSKLLEFQQTFQQRFDEQENNLLANRFVNTTHTCIFSFGFRIE